MPSINGKIDAIIICDDFFILFYFFSVVVFFFQHIEHISHTLRVKNLLMRADCYSVVCVKKSKAIETNRCDESFCLLIAALHCCMCNLKPKITIHSSRQMPTISQLQSDGFFSLSSSRLLLLSTAMATECFFIVFSEKANSCITSSPKITLYILNHANAL